MFNSGSSTYVFPSSRGSEHEGLKPTAQPNSKQEWVGVQIEGPNMGSFPLFGFPAPERYRALKKHTLFVEACSKSSFTKISRITLPCITETAYGFLEDQFPQRTKERSGFQVGEGRVSFGDCFSLVAGRCMGYFFFRLIARLEFEGKPQGKPHRWVRYRKTHPHLAISIRLAPQVRSVLRK